MRYRGWVLKRNERNRNKLERDGRFVIADTQGPAVAFRVLGGGDGDGGARHAGLYRGLDAVVRTMDLGEASDIVLPPALAFDDRGLGRHNGGTWDEQRRVMTDPAKLEREGNVMACPPGAPEDHVDRNPLCVAYVAVPPGASVLLEGLKLVEVNGRSAPSNRSCMDFYRSCCAWAWGTDNDGWGRV